MSINARGLTRRGASGQGRALPVGDDMIKELEARYEVLEQLGEGGMGVVYAAHDHALDRKVAIKTISPELRAHPEAIEIFAAEARIMARMRHPNLPNVHDVLYDGPHATLVMELVDGDSLEQILREHPRGLGLEELLHLWLQLLAALTWLHRQGIIHRDIKPSNLMIDREGSLRLMDFGLARELRLIAQKGTRVRGTPAYMAPEQITGGDLCAATDLYAAAVTIFEALTGHLPFEDGELTWHHLHTPAPDLRQLRPDVPPALAEIVNSCLQKNPEDRPYSARTVLRSLVERLHLQHGTLPATVISELKLSPLRNSGVHFDTAPQLYAPPTPTSPTPPPPPLAPPPPPLQPSAPHLTLSPTPAGPRWLQPALIAVLALCLAAALGAILRPPTRVQTEITPPHPARAPQEARAEQPPPEPAPPTPPAAHAEPAPPAPQEAPTEIPTPALQEVQPEPASPRRASRARPKVITTTPAPSDLAPAPTEPAPALPEVAPAEIAAPAAPAPAALAPAPAPTPKAPPIAQPTPAPTPTPTSAPRPARPYGF
jgi:serine/threonine protein kinase